MSAGAKRLGALLLCLTVLACAQQEEVLIRSSFVELSDEELLSDDPDRLDVYAWSLTLEYPDSICDTKGRMYPLLRDTLRRAALASLFGREDGDAAYAGTLPPAASERAGEDPFVTQAKRLMDKHNKMVRQSYPAARDTLRGDLRYECFYTGYIAGVRKNYVTYHLYVNESVFGRRTRYERGLCYDLSGNRAGEQDLFLPGWEELLPPLLSLQFRRHFKTSDIPFREPVRPNGNFKFSPEGIIWMYDAGEIAAEEYGLLRITLSWSELAPLMK